MYNMKMKPLLHFIMDQCTISVCEIKISHLAQSDPFPVDCHIYKATMSVRLSTQQLSMVDLREKPMAYLESAGSCGCFSQVLND